MSFEYNWVIINIMEGLDWWKLEENKEFEKHIESDENLLFSDKVIKINKYSFSQKRVLAVTTKKLYNFKYSKDKISFRWKVNIKDIHGISKSLVYSSKEFVVHCPKTYDIRYQSKKRNDIINAIKLAFISLTKHDLPIYGIQTKDLREYTTLEKDREKGKSRIPDKSMLIEAENVMK